MWSLEASFSGPSGGASDNIYHCLSITESDEFRSSLLNSTSQYLWSRDYTPAPLCHYGKHSSLITRNCAPVAVQIGMAARAVLMLALSAVLCAGHGAAAARTLQQTADAQAIADALSSVMADPPTAAALVSTCALAEALQYLPIDLSFLPCCQLPKHRQS